MRTPKEMFLTSGHAKAFAAAAVTEAFEVACLHAQAQLRAELPPNIPPGMATDVMVGFDANAQMVGAARVLEILQHLAEPIPEPKEPKKDTLNYAR